MGRKANGMPQARRSDFYFAKLKLKLENERKQINIKKNARRDSASSSRRRRRFKTPTSLTLKTFLKKKVFYTLERFFYKK